MERMCKFIVAALEAAEAKKYIDLLRGRGVDVENIKKDTGFTETEIGILFPKALLKATEGELERFLATGIIKHLNFKEFEAFGDDWTVEDELSDNRFEPEYVDPEEHDRNIVAYAAAADSLGEESNATIIIDKEYLPSDEELAHWNAVLAAEGLAPIGLTYNELNHARVCDGAKAFEFVTF